jgi:tRNA A37 threonylcarbamoyladenosine synthetase subunit TsaC/SUA5/YrdC
VAELAQDVLIRTGPLAVMSANRIGMPAPLSVAELVAGLGDIPELDVILDSGTLDQQAPSSIVDLTGERPRLLREGSVTADQLRVVLGDLEVLE